jgi:hypothetical protein
MMHLKIFGLFIGIDFESVKNLSIANFNWSEWESEW